MPRSARDRRRQLRAWYRGCSCQIRNVLRICLTLPPAYGAVALALPVAMLFLVFGVAGGAIVVAAEAIAMEYRVVAFEGVSAVFCVLNAPVARILGAACLQP